VSDLLEPDAQFDDEPEPGSRRHAVWALVVLGCLALLIASLMVFLGGGKDNKNANAGLTAPLGTGPAVTTTPSASRTSAAATTSHAAASTQAATTTPAGRTRSGNPCQNHAASCAVDGDGGAIAAVNAFRIKHGLSAVQGSVTQAAQTCAAKNGSGATCVPHYAYTSLPSQDGTKAVAKIADFAQKWLLDPQMSTFSVGWAYVGGTYECVLLKAP
jgi:hypothetical protein